MIVWLTEIIKELNTEDRQRCVPRRLRLSVTRGTNIGKDADVGADVMF